MKAQKKFAFDVGWAFASSLGLMFIQFLRKPIMARYLGPAGLGLYSIIVTVVAFFELVGLFGIPNSVIKYTAEYKNQKKNLDSLVTSSIITVLLFGIISSIFLFLLSNEIANIFNMPSLSFFLKLYAIVFPFSFIYTIILTFLNGKRKMKSYSFLDFSRGLLSFFLIVILLVLGFGVEGAVIGSAIGIIVACIVGIKLIMKNINFSIFNYRKNLMNITSFGSRLMFSNAVNIINYQADILLIGYFLSAEDVGYYSVAMSFSQFIWIIPQSIQKISFPAASEYWAENKYQSLNEMIDKSMRFTSIILLILGVSLWFFVEDVILFIFGNQFVLSIPPLRILLIGTVIFGIFKSIGGSLPAIGYPGINFYINTSAAIVNILLNVWLIPRFGITGAAIATITSLIIIVGLNIYFIEKLAKIQFNIKWYILIFGITIIAIVSYTTLSIILNRYLIGILILTIYSTILYQNFLTKEEKEIFKEIFISIFSHRVD